MTTDKEIFTKGRIVARPYKAPALKNEQPGIYTLQLDNFRDGLIYIPTAYTSKKPALLAIMLHGPGGSAEQGLQVLHSYADAYNIILVAPASRASTWDIIVKDTFNADVIFINQALSVVFNKYNIDAGHIAVGGFSDGASYAICLGLSNGDLFTHIIAFSPGFYHTIENTGKPAVFISHGTHDEVLPVAPCGRRIVNRLKRLNYDVRYEEFKGRHEIPGDVTEKAISWFTK